MLNHEFDVANAIDVGAARTDSAGARAPVPTVYDIDGFVTSAATVRALHDRGAKVVCYIETGGWEDYRPDADAYPSTALGRPVDGYPHERYVDIRDERVLEIVRARVDMCASKGFDAIEPDLDDTYREDTGFPLTEQDALAFNRAVAEHAHAAGMAIGLKNGDDEGFAAAMEPLVEFALVEQCFEYDTCDAFDVFVEAGKPVLEVEYNLSPSEFCREAVERGFSAIAYNTDLDGTGTPCGSG
jgi:hypothetical protein